jgi:hypothetical protein
MIVRRRNVHAYTSDQFFWPLWSILGWGIGLAFHSWPVYSGSSLDEARIEREISRIHGRGARN